MTAYTVATAVAPAAGDNYSAQQGCFEGPEKLLELWFSPSPHKLRRVPHGRAGDPFPPSPNGSDAELSEPSSPNGSYMEQDVPSYTAFKANQLRKHEGAGLRVVPKPVWDEMLAIVRCTVLNTIRNDHVDAYLLSESSMFIYPHKMVLKTCGTTTLLNALPRILEIARVYCGFEKVWRVFYSRKSFMFPDKQQGPHRSWKQEVSFLDRYFDNGSAYKIGKMNGDHWYLYLTSPADDVLHHEDDDSVSEDEFAPQSREQSFPDRLPTPLSSDSEVDQSPFGNSGYPQQDQTIEILMTKLNPKAMRKFYHYADEEAGTTGGRRVDQQTGLDAIYPTAQLDSYLFQPCGYSANGLWDGSYWTIHVTPEPSCSYASFETNIPVEISHPVAASGDDMNAKITVKQATPIQALIQQVTTVFQPDSFSVTFFSSHPRVPDSTRGRSRSDSGVGDLHSDLRHHVKDDGRYHHDHTSMVKSMANIEGYKRTDRILYEFEGYDLVFGHYSKV